MEETIRLTARQDLLAAEAALREAWAQRDKVHEKLRLLGFSDAALARSASREHGQRPLIPLVAPFTGTVIERQVTEGQLVDLSSAHADPVFSARGRGASHRHADRRRHRRGVLPSHRRRAIPRGARLIEPIGRRYVRWADAFRGGAPRAPWSGNAGDVG